MFNAILYWALFAATTSVFAKDLELLKNHLYEPLNPRKVYTTAGNAGALKYGWYPAYTTRDTGEWIWKPVSSSSGRFSGFFPSMLYLMAEREKLCPGLAPNVDWVSLGRAWSTPLLQLESRNTIQSSIGIASLPFSDELKVNPSNATARTAVIDFANELAGRFNRTVGAIRSLDPIGDGQIYSVLIDDMENIQVLMAAYQLTQNNTLKTIAMAHADKTIKDHLRGGGVNGLYHIVDYNATTGAIIDRKFSSTYTWSRGLGWAILGFTELYDATHTDIYLETARTLASYFLNNLPKGRIVPWNIKSKQDNPADTSAAMIGAYALARLSEIDTVPTLDGIWKNASAAVLNPNGYLGWKPNYQSILGNGTVNSVAGDHTGTIFGDYYFLKMGNLILRKKWLKCE